MKIERQARTSYVTVATFSNHQVDKYIKGINWIHISIHQDIKWEEERINKLVIDNPYLNVYIDTLDKELIRTTCTLRWSHLTFLADSWFLNGSTKSHNPINERIPSSL